MRWFIFLFIITIVFCSCKNEQEKKTESVIDDTTKIISNKNSQGTTIVDAKKQPSIYIKDKTQYDTSFINGLSNYNGSQINLIGNMIVLDGLAAGFPEDLPQNRSVVFNARKDENIFTLTSTRINFTNVNYKLKITTKENKVLFEKSGTAILGSMFFLASEIDEDEQQAGTAYPSYEYWDKLSGCSFSIRIAHELDDNGKTRATISSNCQVFLNLDTCPILRTQ